MLTIDGCGKGDDNPAYACIDGRERIIYLWQHTTADGAVGLIFNKVRVRDSRDDAVIVIGIAEHPFLLKREDQRYVVIGCQCLGSLTGNGSALVFRICPSPSCVRGAITGVMPSSIRRLSILPSA